MEIKGKEVLAELKITTSQQRRLDNIIVKGYKKFPKSYLKNYLRLKTGEIFNKTKIDKKINQLQEISFAKKIREPEILFTNDSTTLYLYLEKTNSNNFDGFLGFSNEEKNNNINLNGYLNINLTNNLNFGESLNIEYKNNGEEYTYFYTNLELPFLFNTPITPTASLKLTNQDSTFTTNTQSVGIKYQITTNLNYGINYTSQKSNYLLENSSTTVENFQDYNGFFITNKLNYQINSKTPIFKYDTRANLEIGFGKRNIEIKSSPQQFLLLDAENIFHLNTRNHIYVANHSGYLNSKEYLNNELFRTGGIKSLRGFTENSLIADFYSFFNTEYRFLLDQNLYANTILDFGVLENKNQDLKNNVYSIGIGLGMNTKSGLLKLLIANGKTDDNNFKFQNTKVHLSLTTIF